MSAKVNIRLLGVFRGISGKSQVTLEIEHPTVRKVLRKLADSLPPEAKQLLLDSEINCFLPNTIVLVNGKEIGVLKGLETKVKDEDEVVLIPVSHGG